MTIPTYDWVMRPLLEMLSGRGDITLKEASALVADRFSLTDEER